DAQYIVKDIAGNQSVLNFKIRFSPGAAKPSKAIEGRKLKFDQVNDFDTIGLKLNIPLKTLYSDLNFVYKTTPRPAGAYSPIHHIHNRLIPLNGPITMSIKADDNLPAELQSKALIVNHLKKTQGGIFENGYVKTD
ncbi:MAG TPA: M23 family peptidase, partial [Daejeonella sp.]|nr:M23 family peptidase [Daejeonella sp.]